MSVIKNDIVILMTGAIIPNSLETLAIKNPKIRKKQYIDALMFYLTNTKLNIVFTENSGVSLENEFSKYKNRLEFLTYKSIQNIPDKGKGFKELEIINYSMKNSKFIANSDAIIKITGRLKVLNINELSLNFLSLKKKYENMFSGNIYKIPKMDARCFIFSKDFWSYLESKGKTIDLKYSIEMALWDSAIEYRSHKGVFKQLKQPLRIEGLSAGFGKSYNDSFIIALIKKIRHFIKAPYYYQKLKKA